MVHGKRSEDLVCDFLCKMYFWQVFLQASGKVSKKKSANSGAVTKPKPKTKKSTGVGAGSSAVKNNDPVTPNEMVSRPGTASSVGRKVDELFQVSHASWEL